MNPANIVKRCLPRSFKAAVKRELIERFDLPSMEWSLGNMRRLGFRPAGVVDIGAYRGEWTEMARAIFPEAAFLMIEAQESQREILERVKTRNGSAVNYRISLLGSESREGVDFHHYDMAPTGASVLVAQAGAPGRPVKRKMEPLDSVLKGEGFRRPELIKIDVQGYELEVLKGGREALRAAEAVAMEVSLLELYKGNPLLHEVIAFMHERGFQCYDIPALMRRPSDRTLWQVDMIFVKAGSPLVKDTTGLIPDASTCGSQL
jgi:FkbM family methyltransferase